MTHHTSAAQLQAAAEPVAFSWALPEGANRNFIGSGIIPERRQPTKAELDHPGVPGYMFYDPDRPADHPDEIIRIQRMRTRQASANEARRERDRRVAAGERIFS